MLFEFSDRVYLSDILPQESNIVDLRIITDLRQKLGASEEEIKKYGITVEGNKINWKQKFEAEIEIGERANEIIKKKLILLNEQNKLKEGHLKLYERFIENK